MSLIAEGQLFLFIVLGFFFPPRPRGISMRSRGGVRGRRGESRGDGAREGRDEEEKAAGPREGRRQEGRGRRDGRDGYGGKK